MLLSIIMFFGWVTKNHWTRLNMKKGKLCLKEAVFRKYKERNKFIWKSSTFLRKICDTCLFEWSVLVRMCWEIWEMLLHKKANIRSNRDLSLREETEKGWDNMCKKWQTRQKQKDGFIQMVLSETAQHHVKVCFKGHSLPAEKQACKARRCDSYLQSETSSDIWVEYSIRPLQIKVF